MKITRRQAIQTTALTTGSLLFPKALQSANMEKNKEITPSISSPSVVTLRLSIRGEVFEIDDFYTISQQSYLEITVPECRFSLDNLRKVMSQFQQAFRTTHPHVIIGADNSVQITSITTKSTMNNPDLRGSVVVICDEKPRWRDGIKMRVHPNQGSLYLHKQSNIDRKYPYIQV